MVSGLHGLLARTRERKQLVRGEQVEGNLFAGNCASRVAGLGVRVRCDWLDGHDSQRLL